MLVVDGTCDCRSWLLLAYTGFGRCGYCGVRPVIISKPYEEPFRRPSYPPEEEDE